MTAKFSKIENDYFSLDAVDGTISTEEYEYDGAMLLVSASGNVTCGPFELSTSISGSWTFRFKEFSGVNASHGISLVNASPGTLYSGNRIVYIKVDSNWKGTCYLEASEGLNHSSGFYIQRFD